MLRFPQIPLPRIQEQVMNQTETVHEYSVIGMSCDHRVLSVTEELRS